MPTDRYERLNNYVMGLIYAPVLMLTAFVETLQAFRIRRNRRRVEIENASNGTDTDDDGDDEQEWEEMARTLDAGVDDFQADGWAEQVERTRPNVEVDPCILEMRELKAQVVELKAMIKGLSGAQRNGQDGAGPAVGEQTNGSQQQQQLVDVDE